MRSGRASDATSLAKVILVAKFWFGDENKHKFMANMSRRMLKHHPNKIKDSKNSLNTIYLFLKNYILEAIYSIIYPIIMWLMFL